MATPQKSAFWPTKFLYVASLDLDIKNPRLGGIAANFSPKEIVQYLFQHDKAIEVADSIANRGYFPNEPLLAIHEGSRYTVIEGNRRLAALMALREPSLLTGAALRAVERLATKLSNENLKRVPVTIAPNRRATDKQVAGRHVGTPVLAWQSENRARFILEKLEEGYTKEELLSELGFSATDVQAARETQAIMVLARSIDLPPDVKEKIDDLRTKSVSTLERLFESTVGRDIMHVVRDEENGYRVMTSREEFVPFFQKLITLVANNKVSTRTFNTGDDIKAYFKKWSSKDLPTKRSGSFVPSDLVKKGRRKATPPTPKPAPRQKPLFQTVLPTSLKIIYGAPRLRIIRDELTSLNRDKKPNAGAVLLRVFFELCMVDYLVRSGRMTKLEARLKSINVRWNFDYPDMRHLLKEISDVAKKNLRKGEADKVDKALFGNKATPHVLNDLHAFVHDSADLPIGTDILQFWLRTESLFRLMLETDPTTHK
ncbi:MAG: hypothetical protein AB7Q37_10115 [Pyrinomonadaceae bacterium]